MNEYLIIPESWRKENPLHDGDQWYDGDSSTYGGIRLANGKWHIQIEEPWEQNAVTRDYWLVNFFCNGELRASQQFKTSDEALEYAYTGYLLGLYRK